MLAARRQLLLEAMGVTLYRRRVVAPTATATARDGAVDGAYLHTPTADLAEVADHALPPELVIVGARADRGHVEVLARALGLAPARIAFIEATPERLVAAPPHAGAYLALGEVFARPLGAELPTTVQQAAQIVVASAPSQWRNASAKRVLWQTLKPLRRALARS